MKQRYYTLNAYFRKHFGCRVQKISVDAGLSCPNRDGTIGYRGCIYCNARGSGTGAHSAGIGITGQLEAGKHYLAKRYKAEKFMAYFQSFTNTYAPVDALRRMYDEALAVEDVVGLSIGTRPDVVDRHVLDLLASYGKTHLIWIEYGLQTANNTTLARIGRGHDFECFSTAVEKSRRRGIRVAAHVILGLPGESRKEMMATAEALARLAVDGVKLHLLYVVRGTGMERFYRSGGYRCLDQAAYVSLVCDFIERLPPETVIQRLTGDPHPEELVAPEWSLRKAETLNCIHRELEKRDTWQGRRLNPV